MKPFELRFQLIFQKVFRFLLSKKAKERIERIFLGIAIFSFLVHLALILLQSLDVLNLPEENSLFQNPVGAIYTPFSFILIYEVYLLVYFLPKSITTYISKQYEIITLIIIRRLFKDLSNLKLSSDWFQIQNDLQFTYDILTALILFLLIYLFYRFRKNNVVKKLDKGSFPVELKRFIRLKKMMAIILVPILLGLAIYTLSDWFVEQFITDQAAGSAIKNLNHIFFDEFFTTLIVADVLLLLFSLFLTDKFHKVIRNSGFVVSTILIRISFSVDGLVNNLLILTAVLFGLLILLIHNLYEKEAVDQEKL